MSSRRYVPVLFLMAFLIAATIQAPARAGDPTESPWDLSDTQDGYGQSDPLLGTKDYLGPTDFIGPGDFVGADPMLTPEAADPWCVNPQEPGDYAYKMFRRTPTPPDNIPIYVDQYLPPAPGAYHVMLWLHGGAWWRGCRGNLTELAQRAADDYDGTGQKYIVLVADYRLACAQNDPPPGSTVTSLCGWTFQTPDYGWGWGGAPNAAIHDVIDLVTWARHTWPTSPGHAGYSIKDNKVVLVGGSSGGNVGLMGTARMVLGEAPNALAVWSNNPELTRMSAPNNNYGCDNFLNWHNTNDPLGCWQGVNRYLGCVIAQQPDPACETAGRYAAGSPLFEYGIGDSPVFFANGGGPIAGVSGPETVALHTSDDFDAQLALLGVTRTNCIVDTNLHGTAYLYPKACDAPVTGKDVWTSSVNFLVANA